MPVPPRAFLAPKNRRGSGVVAPVDGIATGRTDVSLCRVPVVETPVVVQDAKVLIQGAGAANAPAVSPDSACLVHGSRERRSLSVVLQRRNVALSQPNLDGLVWLKYPLARICRIHRRALGIPRGCQRGTGSPPPRWAWYYHAHLVLKPMSSPPLLPFILPDRLCRLQNSPYLQALLTGNFGEVRSQPDRIGSLPTRCCDTEFTKVRNWPYDRAPSGTVP